MQRSAIRELAVSEESGLLAAAFFDKRVQIWSWKTGKLLGDFETVYSFGLESLLLTTDGSICIATGWGRGLAAYSVPDGTLLWRGKNINGKNIHRIGSILFSASGSEIYCGAETNAVLIVDVQSGQTVDKIGRADRVYSSQFSSHELVVKKEALSAAGRTRVRIPAMSFGLHTAAFSPTSVCISEPPLGGIRCVDLASGELLWDHWNKAFGRAAFNVEDGHFYCKECNGNTPPDWFLTRLSPEREGCEPIALLTGGWEAEFTKSGTTLITANGDVFETASGRLFAILIFRRGTIQTSKAKSVIGRSMEL